MLRNIKIATLFFTMVVVMIGFGIIIPIMPFYVEHFGAGGFELGSMMAVFSVMQFFSSPFWGNMSDRHGRKKIMLIGVAGNAISMIIMGLAGSFMMVFLSRAFAGLISSATLPTAMAYIGDSTSEEERGGGMGLIGAAMGVGMVLGPGLGGWLAGDSFTTPFFLAAGMSLLAFVLIALLLPESLPEHQRAPSDERLQGPQISILWKALYGPLGFLLFLAFLVNFALASFEGIFGLYAGHHYGYGPAQVGSVMMIVGIVSSLVQAVLTGPATRKLGEPMTIKLSLIASGIGFLLMLIAAGDLMVYLTVGIFVFSNAMLRPSIMSLASKLAQGGQGEALGLNNAFQSLGRVVGPLWAGFTFDINLNFPYISGALIMFVTFLYAIWKVDPGRARAASAPSRGVVQVPLEDE